MGLIEISISKETEEKIKLDKATAFATKTKQGTTGDFFFLGGERYDLETVMRVRAIVAIDCFWQVLGAMSKEELLEKMKEPKTISYIALQTTYYYIHFLLRHR